MFLNITGGIAMVIVAIFSVCWTFVPSTQSVLAVQPLEYMMFNLMAVMGWVMTLFTLLTGILQITVTYLEKKDRSSKKKITTG